ncbi:MAG: NUDIX hydrolase [Planctomycetes bacterium]|nr:NUDIX hydrolase [Planctomycetota bacterium]
MTTKTTSRLGRPREVRRDEIMTGRIFSVARCNLRYRDGSLAKNDLVVHHGAAVFAPIPRKGRILLIRQYRHAAGDYLWEIPAGRVERGERALATAKRELAEECSLEARRWVKAAAFYPAPGYTTEIMHLFFCYELSKSRLNAQMDADEEIVVKEFSIKKMEKMIKNGLIVDGKTIVAAMYLKLGYG